ncbi:hypothetical protein [Stagnihabitans tardus]|uniref:Uncharacterized protein n=1 Tax=Stagnihabitans tardus TaxID=2699202 RepID=A0AAE4Y8Y5_9RHOB|nr:hypothetical protein [Stagnihabitans tardus]NBZ87369.1 hypothetical protein [Stagnihabitans tardus]
MQESAPKEIKPAPETQIAKLLVRALWIEDWKTNNPKGTSAERVAAWKEARAEQFATHSKTFRKALLALKKSGVEMTLTPKADPETEAE